MEDWNEKRLAAVSEVRREILGIQAKKFGVPKKPFKSDYAQRSFFVKELNVKGNVMPSLESRANGVQAGSAERISKGGAHAQWQ